MSRPRFFLAAPLPKPGGSAVTLPLTDDDVRHAVRVLRLRAGEELECVEPAGGVWVVKVEAAHSGGVSAYVGERLPDAPRPGMAVVLVAGVTKGDKMDDTVRHAVEIGVTEVVPVLFSRTIVKLDDAKRRERGERWRRIAKSAAEQAHRDRVPFVHDPVVPGDLPAHLAPLDGVIVLWEEAGAEAGGISDALAGVEAAGPDGVVQVALVVGPEGGLTAEEVDGLVEAGARVAGLGRFLLRAETAALVGLALVIHELGGLGRS